MVKGRIRYIPPEVDAFFNQVQREDNLPDLVGAMRRTQQDALLGRETRKLAKKFGWSFGLK
jgi:hypothetical protein